MHNYLEEAMKEEKNPKMMMSGISGRKFNRVLDRDAHPDFSFYHVVYPVAEILCT